MSQHNNYFVVREGRPDDANLIYSSWLNSYRDAYLSKHVAKTPYFAGQHAIIDKIFKSPACRVYIAAAPDDADHVLGYAVWEESSVGPIIHFIYVKLSFRNFKIGTTLFDMIRAKCPGRPIYTHLPKGADKLLAGKNLEFNPYLAFL